MQREFRSRVTVPSQTSLEHMMSPIYPRTHMVYMGLTLTLVFHSRFLS